jgi:peptide chain release factor subunit 1
MVKLTPKQRYDFKKLIEELESYKGRATELITLYVPAGKLISDVTGYLRNEYSQSSNIKSKSTKKNVMSAIDSIMSRLRNIRMAPDHGLAFFVGHIPIGADQTRMIARVVEPPVAITTFMYRCDSYFYLDHLKDMLMEEEVYGLIVIDHTVTGPIEARPRRPERAEVRAADRDRRPRVLQEGGRPRQRGVPQPP